MEAAHRCVRDVTAHHEADYLFQDDLRRIAELLDGRALLDSAGLR